MSALAQRNQDLPLAGHGSPGKGWQGQYLTFMLEGETYGVGILAIKEIIEYGQLTLVPMMPSFIRGVINLRGQVVPVVDLAARFGHGNTQVARRTCIIIIEIEQSDERQLVGVMVDAVNEVVELARQDIEPPPMFGAKIRPEFIAGMGKLDNRFVILLDVSQVLSVDEMVRLTDMVETAEPRQGLPVPA
jgi:purine-binding chemotaxis protein CheW